MVNGDAIPRSIGPADRGYALTVALVVTTVALAGVALLVGALRQADWLLDQRSRSLHLTAICDAGVARSLARLSIDAGWTGVFDEPINRGRMTIEVRKVSTWVRVVTVRAGYATGRRAIEATVRLSATDSPRVTGWRRLPTT